MDASAAVDPPPPGPPVVVETHSALIFPWGDEAHRVRKPVDLGFLDNTTAAARGEQSRREVELNSRLAPDVYRGVLEVRGPDGEVIDHAWRCAGCRRAGASPHWSASGPKADPGAAIRTSWWA